eukprot:gene2354-2660_t
MALDTVASLVGLGVAACLVDDLHAAMPKVASCSSMQLLQGGWIATLDGSKNIAPNTTGVPAPTPGPARGSYELILDEAGRRASWRLQLCDVPRYIASHLHTGAPNADYPPPLIPLEPYVKPPNPFAPPTQLPRLCPALNIYSCSYNVQGSFTASDISPLPGRDAATPAVAE